MSSSTDGTFGHDTDILPTEPVHRTITYRGSSASHAWCSPHPWLGDAAPDLVPEDASFLVMVGFFLVAQLVLAFAQGFALPRHGFWVMLTYVVARCLVVVGVHREARRAGPAVPPP